MAREEAESILRKVGKAAAEQCLPIALTVFRHLAVQLYAGIGLVGVAGVEGLSARGPDGRQKRYFTLVHGLSRCRDYREQCHEQHHGRPSQMVVYGWFHFFWFLWFRSITGAKIRKVSEYHYNSPRFFLQEIPTCVVETQRTQRTQRNNDEKSVYQEMPRHFPDRLRDENNGVSPLCRGFTTNGTRHRLLL